MVDANDETVTPILYVISKILPRVKKEQREGKKKEKKEKDERLKGFPQLDTC